MRRNPVTPARFVVGALLATVLVGLIGLVAVTQIAQHTGRSVYVIHGSSMSPALPLGAAVLTTPVDPTTIRPGDVITVRTDTGLTYTHRVAALVRTAEGTSFQTKGDANASPDPQSVPTRAIVGRVDVSMPYAGFALAMLNQLPGVLSVVSMLGALLLLYWLLEDLELDWATSPVPDGQPRPETGSPAQVS